MFSRIASNRLLHLTSYLGALLVSIQFANAQLLPIPDEGGFVFDPARSAFASELAWIAFAFMVVGIVLSIVIVVRLVMRGLRR